MVYYILKQNKTKIKHGQQLAKMNGSVLLCNILKLVVASVVDAQPRTLFLNTKKEITVWCLLQELEH